MLALEPGRAPADLPARLERAGGALGLPARFFAEAGEFLFVEAFVVFPEDLLSPGQILLLDGCPT